MTDKIKNEVVPLKSENGFITVVKNYINGDNGIAVAPNYDAVGAVKYLYLQFTELKDKAGRPAKDVVTEASVQKAIREMVAQGLNPMKNQVYPIVYGNQLKLSSSYQGNKRKAYTANDNIVKGSIRSQVIYKGDIFEDRITPDGRTELVKHVRPPFEKRSDEPVGAYAVVTFKGGKTDMDVMTIKEIHASWAKSKTGGAVHKEFPHEMICKTVESRLAKKLYSATDESSTEATDHFQKMREESQAVEYDISDTYEDAVEVEAEEVLPEFLKDDSDELPDLPEFESEEDAVEPEENAPFEVPYGTWKNEMKDTGEYEAVGKYNQATKMITVRKVVK